MEFDPDNHDTQPVIASRGPRRLISPLGTAVFVFLALIAWLGSGLLFNSNKVEAAKPISVDGNSARNFKVVVQEITARPYPNTIILQARSEADKLVTVASETGGTINQLPVSKGSLVQKGQIICRIDVGARAAQLAQARAQRDARKIEFNAAQKLVKQGHMSKSQMAAAQAAFDASVAAVKSALVELERTKIRAPFDGILDRQPVKIGHYMSPGQPCGTIIDKDPLLVVGYISENQINRIGIGATGQAKLSTGEVAQGKVRYIAESPNLTTRTFRVELEVANKDLQLRDGMTAELTINAGEVVASRVPQSVLTLAGDGRLGVRVLQNNRVVIRPIQIIKDDQDGAVVTGLGASEMVIVRGGEFTRDGREVDFEMLSDAKGTAQ
ncbi:MAG: efflux RND transporter periplasmic adaptor subunit [Alphaproteobacteria bacterium]|nr:efflux RND transporter periplasmic adaptor subunit [Alphaproteobacteria bacterium]